MTRYLVSSAWVAALSISLATAQPVRKEPAYYAGTERASRVEVPPPGIRLSLHKPREFALAPLSDSERALLAKPGTRVRVGVHRGVTPDLLSTGAWETTRDGARVWRMAIRSPGAIAIRIEFFNFSVGEGKVWIHDGTHVAGPYSGTGLFDDGHFWSASVPAESVTIEYQAAPGAAPDSVLPFEIRTVAHRAVSVVRGRPSPSRPILSGLAPVATTPPPDPAAYCHLDPNCYPEWQSAMKMVGRMVFEVEEGEAMCTGSMISTRDNSFKLYLLTAGHCINEESAARSLEVDWTYQTSACAATPPENADASTKSTGGGHLIGWGTVEQGDYSMVLLQNVPAGLTFAGWDVTDPPMGVNVAGIHHPMGSWKRISFGTRVKDESVIVENDEAPADKFFEIAWDKGRTQPGSSGSPLFTSPGVIVGTLTYGWDTDPPDYICQLNGAAYPEGYGRFSVAYQALSAYLENLPAAAVTPDKTSLQYTVTNGVASAGQTVKLTTLSSGQISYKLRADAPWIQLSTITGTLSASSPAQVSITVDPSKLTPAGKYASTVTILSGAAAPVFVNVAATVTLAQSNVVASVSPNPVSQSGGQWSFTIKLAETGGAATQVTAIKLNGTDYSSSIATWFGTNEIPANGSIQAPLSGTGTFPKGDQYFEVWGVDDSGGQHWYRVLTVTFN